MICPLSMMSHRGRLAAFVAALGIVGLAARALATTDGGPTVGDRPPEISAGKWLNSPPLSLAGLKGKVVLLEFWSPG